MDIRVLGRSVLILVVAALLLYGFSIIGSDSAAIQTPIDSLWKLLALAFAFSFVLAWAWPHVRGIRKGDALVIVFQRGNATMPVVVTALSDARKGARIKIAMQNGREGEAVVTQYASTFSPAQARLLETEVQVE